MKRFLLTCVLVLVAAVAGTSTAAAANPLDTTFGRKGVTVVPAASYEWRAAVGAVVEDGHGLLVVGSDEWGIVVTRLEADGRIDASYGRGGLVSTEFGRDIRATSAVLQPDGRLLVVGGGPPGVPEGFMGLARYMPDGSLDPSFGEKGKVMVPLGGFEGGRATGVALQPGGRIVVAGTSRANAKRSQGVVARFLADGSLDRSFDENGLVRLGRKTTLQDLEALPNGRLLAGGRARGRFLLAKLRSDGRPDRSFGMRGRKLIDVDGPLRCHFGQCAEIRALALDRGRIAAVGWVADERSSYSALVRLRPDGTLVRPRGVVRIRRGFDLGFEDVVARRGSIAAAGYFEGFETAGSVVEVVKFHRNGRPDRRFGEAGVFTRRVGYDSPLLTAMLQRDGRVVVGGYALTGSPPEGFVEDPSPFEDMQMLLMRFEPGMPATPHSPRGFPFRQGQG